MKKDYRDLSLEELQKLQAKHREQQERMRKAYEARKARTRRLIIHGGILEKIVPTTAEMTPAEVEAMLISTFGQGK